MEPVEGKEGRTGILKKKEPRNKMGVLVKLQGGVSQRFWHKQETTSKLVYFIFLVLSGLKITKH